MGSKTRLLVSAWGAALAISAAIAGSAWATQPTTSTVGSKVCPVGSNTLPCGTSTALNLQDWGGFEDGGGANANDGYHCSNVLYVGPPSAVGTNGGTTYYTVGNPSVNTTYNGAADTDCSPPGSAPSSSTSGGSIVLLRATGYLNTTRAPAASQPTCPGGTPPTNGRNPGCGGNHSAGYIGIGGPTGTATGATADLDGGVQGDIP